MNAAAAGAVLDLPVGLFHDRGRHQRARLRPLSGVEELRVQEAAAIGEPRTRVATGVLAACTLSIGDLDDIDEPLVEALCIGDREALLLHLHRLTFGEAIQAVVPCPACGELLDLDLQVADLLVPPVEGGEAEAVVTLAAAGARWRARLRRVTGADQAAALKRPDPAAQLLRQCVVALEREAGDLGSSGREAGLPMAIAREVVEPFARDAWPPELADELDASLAALDPQAEIRLDLTCPECRQRFAAPFDAAGHLLAEIAAETGLLLAEVTTIARTFHWSEAQILALPRPRRRAYAALAVTS